MKGKPLKICSVADTCDYCGQTSTTKRCSACHDARYCDMICLQKHRSDHKPQCLLIQEEKAKKEAKARKRAEVLEGLGEELYSASFRGKEARVGQLLKLGIDMGGSFKCDFGNVCKESVQTGARDTTPSLFKTDNDVETTTDDATLNVIINEQV